MMPSGESLVRQYLYGQRYFKGKFGSYCREAWLPDTFGYASQLPQILRLAGLNYFFTQKVSKRPLGRVESQKGDLTVHEGDR
jgi:alpha-mannosidase